VEVGDRKVLWDIEGGHFPRTEEKTPGQFECRKQEGNGGAAREGDQKEWAIRPADKGGGVTIERYGDMAKDGKEELKDQATFKELGKKETRPIILRTQRKLRDMMENEYISRKMRKYLSAKNTHQKVNRKVHKEVKKNGRHPTRVYVSGIWTSTEKIAGLVESE
jgi:hypothetical protein